MRSRACCGSDAWLSPALFASQILLATEIFRPGQGNNNRRYERFFRIKRPHMMQGCPTMERGYLSMNYRAVTEEQVGIYDGLPTLL